jgi:hypothetical protein
MDQTVRLTQFSDVKFGTLGTVVLCGKGPDEAELNIVLDLTDITRIAPRLMHAATVALRSLAEAPGSPIPICFVPVASADAFAARDNKEPCLTVHTHGGMLQFQFPPDVAIECGRDLLAIGIEASAPDQSAMH